MRKLTVYAEEKTSFSAGTNPRKETTKAFEPALSESCERAAKTFCRSTLGKIELEDAKQDAYRIALEKGIGTPKSEGEKRVVARILYCALITELRNRTHYKYFRKRGENPPTFVNAESVVYQDSFGKKQTLLEHAISCESLKRYEEEKRLRRATLFYHFEKRKTGNRYRYRIQRRVFHAIIHRESRRFPVGKRKALALYLQGLKQKEVAERTGADVTEIYLLTYRFRVKVRTAVGYYARRIN